MNKIALTDFKRLAVLLLPVRLRRSITTAFCDVMMQPFSYAKRLLCEFADKKAQGLRITGQTCKLEKLLNDTFDNEQRRIRITDSSTVDLPAVYVFQRGDENNVLYLYQDTPKIYLQLSSALAGVATDFYVELPKELDDLFYNPQLKALVNTYKLASKRWLTRIL